MITVKPIVVPSNRRKDGTLRVFIRVYFSGKVRRVPTSILCRPGDLTRSGRIKSPSVLEAATKISSRMLDAVSSIPEPDLAGKDVDWVLARMNCADALHNFRLDFFRFADEVLALFAW